MNVQNKQCDQCLFSKNKIVSDERKQDLIDTCDRETPYFVCHKSSMKDGRNCCRGYYDRYMKDHPMINIAISLGKINFVKDTI